MENETLTNGCVDDYGHWLLFASRQERAGALSKYRKAFPTDNWHPVAVISWINPEYHGELISGKTTATGYYAEGRPRVLTASEYAQRVRDRRNGIDVPKLKTGIKPGFKQAAAYIEERKKKVPRGPASAQWLGDAAKFKSIRERPRKMIPSLEGKLCERCGAPAEDRHHKDEDVYNNDPSNIELLCEPCHIRNHGNIPRKHLGFKKVGRSYVPVST